MAMTGGAPGQRSRRVTVLWLARGLGPGGMERLLVTHAQLGDPERFRYLVAYLTERPKSVRDELEAAGAEVIALGDRPLAAARRLRSLMATRGVDVVHAHSPLPAVIGRVVSRTLSSRPSLVYTEHNSWACYGVATRLANALTYPLDDEHLAVSAAAAASVPRVLARPRPTVLLHGLPTPTAERPSAARGRQVRRQLDLDEDALMVLCVANHRPEKDYGNLIEALAALRRRLTNSGGAGVMPTVVSAGAGPLIEQARELATTLGVSEWLRLLGHRDDVPDLMAAADALVLPSRFEGLPVALMEATAAGLPVVATCVGGVPEVLVGQAGELLVPAEDPEALAGALHRLADPELRRRLSAASVEVAAQFDATNSVAAQEALYARLAR